ncbi:hypothetical protein ACIGB6_17705 [Paeniglutamicibacter gangotriensis]|uniref:DUF433 domain-containing protein n=2 Tax=Paeniglutamicibacter gangotriensis TaxID=254787 RepID=M7MSK3_9MICC|nr:hypothetical protein [Paeniglutamicibacter gangotriensis]EMQ97915.1 hypothetical protein ADIAG_02858 [Paeniglutamicibacter gangotriensis Lz1y]KAA0978911.1 hypothetical protein FQ154_03925 [Paeniglutamicibacter gangotriensis]
MGTRLGMPAYPTLQELRTAGWTMGQISEAYGVEEPAIRAALASHFLHRNAPERSPFEGVVGDQLVEPLR